MLSSSSQGSLLPASSPPGLWFSLGESIMVESQRIPGVDLGSTTEPQVVRIIVKTPWQKEEFWVHKDMLVREFKEHVARHLSSAPDQLVLVYTGRLLKDHRSLAQHGIHLDSNAAVFAVVRSQRGHPSQQVSTVPTDVASDSKPCKNSPFASDGLRELTASLGLNTANFAEFQSQLMSNPDLMLQLLENPFIQSKLSSPDLVKELGTNSPQVRQVIQRAPEISHVFSSPEGMRLVVELARNPAAVREIIRSSPQALACPASVPSGDSNTALQEVLVEVQKAFPKRSGPSLLSGAPGGHQPSFDHSEKPGRARQQLPSPRPWPQKSGAQSFTAVGSDHSKGESGTLRGESGQLASAAVKNLLHQIIKHLMQSMASGSPLKGATGQGLGPDPLGKAVQRNMAGSRNAREQVPALLQQIQSTDILLANWSPKEIQGLLEIQQRLQALATNEPAVRRPSRPERPARKAHSIASLCDLGPPGGEDFSAHQLLQTLVGEELLGSAPISGRMRGSSAQPSSKQQWTYKL